MPSTIVIVPTRIEPQRIEWPRMAQNEHVVTASLMRQGQEGINAMAVYKQRELMSAQLNLIVAGGGGQVAPRRRWAGYFKTGRGVTTLVFRTLLSPAYGEVTAQPIVRFFLTRVSDSMVFQSTDIEWGSVGGFPGSENLSDFHLSSVRQPVDELTEYHLELEAEDFGRPMGFHVHEVVGDIPADPDLLAPDEFAKGQYVTADQVESMVKSATRYRRDNAKTLFNHSELLQDVPRVQAGNTILNVGDNGSTITATDAHFHADLRYLNTRANPNVRITWATKTQGTGVQGNAVCELWDISGPSVLASTSRSTVAGAPGWQTSTVDVAAAAYDLAVTIRGENLVAGVTSGEFYACSLYVDGE